MTPYNGRQIAAITVFSMVLQIRISLTSIVIYERGVIFHEWKVALWAWLLQGVQDFVARSVAARPHALKLASLTFKNLWEVDL